MRTQVMAVVSLEVGEGGGGWGGRGGGRQSASMLWHGAKTSAHLCATRWLQPPVHAGWCIFNDQAVAARAAQRDAGVGRVLFVDLDVHQVGGSGFLLGWQAFRAEANGWAAARRRAYCRLAPRGLRAPCIPKWKGGVHAAVQGDGTAAIFAEDPSVYTLSLHCGAQPFPHQLQV